MTDEEIEKALRVCIETPNNCIGCAYYEKGVHGINCRNMIIRDTLGYINRLKSENEKLKDTLNAIESDEINLRGNLEECVDKLEQIRKDTAKAILKLIESVKRGENGMRYRNPDCVIASKIKEKYGVEVAE